jgi:hypothetical protein
LLDPEIVDEGEFSYIQKFVQACPKVSSLSIEFPCLSNYPLELYGHFLGSKRLEFLETLCLATFSIDAEELVHVLYRHRATLRSLMFEDIVLQYGCWTSIFKSIHTHLHLDDFNFHNLYEAGVKHYHSPQAGLLACKYRALLPESLLDFC